MAAMVVEVVVVAIVAVMAVEVVVVFSEPQSIFYIILPFS
jgi:hypothetical protein